LTHSFAYKVKRKYKGLAKLGNIVAETNFAAQKTKNVFAWSQKHFASRTQTLRPKHMLPSLATPRET